jgi:hypothetical protein
MERSFLILGEIRLWELHSKNPVASDMQLGHREQGGVKMYTVFQVLCQKLECPGRTRDLGDILAFYGYPRQVYNYCQDMQINAP